MMGKLLKFGFENFCWLVLNKYCKIQSNSVTLPDEPFIICSNHRSHLDTPALMLASKKSFNNFYMLAAKDYFLSSYRKNKIFSHLLNLILVERNANTRETLRLIRECQQVKQQNKNLIIYPEGTRSMENHIKPFKEGVVFLAKKLGMPIVPAAITGTADALPKNKIFISPALIKIKFGNPIYQNSLHANSSNESVAELTKKLQCIITQLCYANESKRIS